MRSNIFRHNSDPLRCIKHFRGSGFFGAALSVVSVGIEDEYGAVFATDLDRLAGVGALVEQVETRLGIVVWDRFADGLPRRFDGLEGVDVEGRSGGGGMPMILSQSPWSRRKNSISPARKKVSTTFIVALQEGHWSGSAPQTRRMRSRQSGRMARAVTLGGGGTMGGLAAGCFSPTGSVSAAVGRGMPRLLFE
jgi:hypothetical protein